MVTLKKNKSSVYFIVKSEEKENGAAQNESHRVDKHSTKQKTIDLFSLSLY
ncbi:hypothetical protein FQR65_LT11644 [Abscondita terminalis]|nr:hypothetical protein FQR65_LT11644 [Abscondita terminalis]